MENCIHIPTRPRRIGFLAWIGYALALGRQRRRLGNISDRLLDDMGIDRESALYEASKPIWNVPTGWRR